LTSIGYSAAGDYGSRSAQIPMKMNKSYLRLTTFAAALAFSGCLQQTPTIERYARDGVEFSHSSNWRIETDEPTKDEPTVRVIQIDGPNEATVMIVLTPAGNERTLKGYATSVAQGRTSGLKKKFAVGSIQAGDAEVGSSQATMQNVGGRQVPGIHQQFAVTLLGMDVPHEASFYLIDSPRHRTFVMTQTATETESEAHAGWQPILESLHIE
jgi:hypothetical protein